MVMDGAQHQQPPPATVAIFAAPKQPSTAIQRIAPLSMAATLFDAVS